MPAAALLGVGLVASLLALIGFHQLSRRARRRNKLARRRKNIAFQRSWDWIMGRNKFPRLRDHSRDDA